MSLLIYKTDIENLEALHKIYQEFKEIPSIKNWTIDFDDVDNVLRIELTDIIEELNIMNLVNELGIFCEELV